MSISKFVLNGVTQMDVTDTTATAEDVASGKYFYNAAGVKTEGTSSGGGIDISDYLDTDISGLSVVYQNSNITLTGSSIIDTGVKLFSSENIGKDFKVIFTDLYADKSKNQSPSSSDSIFSSKAGGTPYPGITCRPYANNVSLGGNNGNIGILDKTLYYGMVISRKNGTISVEMLGLIPFELSYSTSNQTRSPFAISKNGELTTVTDVHFVLGGEVEADNSTTTGRRFVGGSIGSVVIAIDTN